MNLMTDAPEPTDNGVIGNQTVGSVEIPPDAGPPLTGELLPNAFRGLATENPRNFGGAQNARIFDAWVNDLVNERDHAKLLAKENQSKLDQALAELHAEKIEIVRLEGGIGHNFRLGLAQRMCTFFSPFLFGIAVDVYKTYPSQSFLIFVFAGGLLLTNFIPSRGKRR
ncbi:hypothetical protein [Pseudomonas lutea]|uniref:Uncharacterized protein n=1 Tax=Pseudomonas lutea TaxID=243924 RepID=A0A9X0EE12_9PSED|nr:hypothetical protein [Pseudomonas lutea]KGF64062.1 hypothetical protein LT42_19485 [Pseudomonas lutea]